MKMKAPHSLTFLYYLLLLHLISLQPSSAASINGGKLLLDFKASLPNTNTNTQLLQNWSPSTNVCFFTGVTCKESKISSIDLSSTPLNIDFKLVSEFLLPLPNLETLYMKNSNLTGTVASAGKYSCSEVLSYIDLAGNTISGQITDISSFESCSNLKSLNLSMNLLEFHSKDNSEGLRLNLQSLDLSFNKIVGNGVVPWLIENGCGELEYLSLKGNKVEGGIPVLNCKSLEYLDLSANNFSTVFPSFGDCSRLSHLDLSGNKFSGEVVDSISSCQNLSYVNLTHNHLVGELPEFPTGVRQLYLSGNKFYGAIPYNLSNLCSSLIELDLSLNHFVGVLPENLGACTSLQLLDVSNNNFSGELPIDTLLKMSSLKTLVLGFNNFVGELPESFSKMTNLETLDVSSNNITGPIPIGLCQDPRNSYKVLYLQNNMFTGPIPESLSNCSELVSLDLSLNYITGTIPSSLGSLSKLKDLILWLNHLHGEIPHELVYLQALENLILDFNDLTGSIPASLSNCTNLNWISLSNNQLTGVIPASFGALSNLAILKLGNNSISGSIPAELGDCRSLIWMDLNSNSLNGSIPPALFKQSGKIADALLSAKSYVYIRNDGSIQCHGAGNLLEFGGIRPEQLDRISSRHPCNFTRVYEGKTQLTFNRNGSMIFLDLSFNKLGGSIPKELGSMYYLSVLNLGHNDLAGPIPPELGGLKNVAILDLSYNRLNGSIPNSFSSLTLLGDADLSNNNLSGMIPESAPFDTFPDYRFLNNSGLCGYPLPRCGGDPSPKTNGQHPKSNRTQPSLIGSVTFGLLFSLFCIIGAIIILVETKKRNKKKDAAALEAYMEGNSNSGTANSAWKLTSVREALSINLAAFEKPLRKLTFADLLEATNGFHNDSLIGSGGFGDVYRAQLKDATVVAIKKLIHVSGQGDREFTAEMETIGKIKHRNLVPLLGYCKVGDERLLVYEYMKFGSLDDVLHARKKIGTKFDWPARRKVAIGAARGLAFLHHNCIPHIIHRDMKSSNVLIDENLDARVSDFGMARLMSAMDTHLSVSTLAGTPGYVPPEYYQSFRCSTKGDVYSYGVVLLELLTGRQPTDSPDFDDNNLVGWVKQHGKPRISDVFDPELLKEDKSLEIELLQHLKVACACLDDRPWKRPTMIQVMAMFKEIQAGSGVDSASTISVDEGGYNAVDGVETSIKEDLEMGKQC